MSNYNFDPKIIRKMVDSCYEDNSSETAKLIADTWEEIEDAEKPTLFSDFCGVHGLDWYADKLGFRTIGCCDYDKHSVACHYLNFPNVPILQWDRNEKTGQDILNELGIERGALDVYCAGAPCVLFSMAGSRGLTGVPINLTRNLARDIKMLGCKVAILEQVPAILNHPMWAELVRMFDAMTEYKWSYQILCACHHGAPTMRYRLFIYLVRRDVYDGEITFPQPTTYGDPAMLIRNVAPHIAFICGGRRQLSLKMKNSTGICPTITATRSLKVVTVEAVKRWMLAREAAKFQGFPQSLLFAPNSRGEQSEILNTRRIGNSVPPPLGAALLKHVRDTYLI